MAPQSTPKWPQLGRHMLHNLWDTNGGPKGLIECFNRRDYMDGIHVDERKQKKTLYRPKDIGRWNRSETQKGMEGYDADKQNK